MKIEIISNPIQSEYITLEKGKRSFIHPNLRVIEDYDCDLVYNRIHKFFVVDYKRINGSFTKTFMTTNIDSMIEILFE
jgi:hypothetical protein